MPTDDFRDPYLIPGTDCLKNRLGISDRAKLTQVSDRIAAGGTGKALGLVRAHKGPWGPDDWKEVHRTLFDRVFDWAGEFRSTDISRGQTQFCPAGMIDSVLTRRFNEINQALENGEFHGEHAVSRIAHHFHRLNDVHPFREGNGRSQKVLMTGIAEQAGLSLRWNRIPGGKEAFHAASAEASRLDSGAPLEPLIGATLGLATKTRPKDRERDI